MINLTDNAKKHLDNYLQQVRTCLKDCPTVDADEVEQNIKEHIESELQGSLEPVSFDALDDILKKLGSPQQWLPEEISWWRKTILRLRTGPEDWRLAYLSFGLLVVGFMLSRLLLPLLILASFIVSRAALSANNYRIEVKAQKWLIYPSLIIVYLVLLCSFLGLPLLGLIPLAYDWEHTIRATYKIGDDTPYWLAACSVFVALIGLWWLIHGVVFLARPNIPKVLFRPFADGFNRRWALVLLCVGFALLVFSLASLYWILYGRYIQPI
jgi:hypothetical protein